MHTRRNPQLHASGYQILVEFAPSFQAHPVQGYSHHISAPAPVYSAPAVYSAPVYFTSSAYQAFPAPTHAHLAPASYQVSPYPLYQLPPPIPAVVGRPFQASVHAPVSEKTQSPCFSEQEMEVANM